MRKPITMFLIALFLTSCTSPPKTTKHDNPVPDDAAVRLDPQTAVSNCVTPHEVYTFPPQAIPGIPAILSRHGECMGVTNVVVVIWPQEPNRVNLLYVKMLVESYLMHLQKSNELFNAHLVSVDTVTIAEGDTAEISAMPASAAVFKLVHVQQKEQK